MPKPSRLPDYTSPAQWKQVCKDTVPGRAVWIDRGLKGVVPPSRTTKIEANIAVEMVRWLKDRAAPPPYKTIVEALGRKSDDARHLARRALKTIAKRAPAKWTRVLGIWRKLSDEGRAEGLGIWATTQQRDDLFKAASRDRSPQVRAAAVRNAFWTESKPFFETVARRVGDRESNPIVKKELAYCRAMWDPGYVATFKKESGEWDVEYLCWEPWMRHYTIASEFIPGSVVERLGLGFCVEHAQRWWNDPKREGPSIDWIRVAEEEVRQPGASPGGKSSLNRKRAAIARASN